MQKRKSGLSVVATCARLVNLLTMIRLCTSRLANKHYLKVADLAAIEADYYKAIGHYERIAKSSVSNNLMKWSVKDYLLKAGICHLATNVCSIYLHENLLSSRGYQLILTFVVLQDLVAINRALESYRDIDPSFASTREHQLLVDLVQAIEQSDQEAFTDKLFQFDQLSKLDKWKTTLLLRVKGNIEETGEDFA